jgi:hypothetical protein
MTKLGTLDEVVETASSLVTNEYANNCTLNHHKGKPYLKMVSLEAVTDMGRRLYHIRPRQIQMCNTKDRKMPK